MDKLNFLTAGIPIAAGKTGYKGGFGVLKELNLDGLELEFVRGVRISEESKKAVKAAISQGFVVTAHAPFYVNLNAKEPEKVEASVGRIVETAQTTRVLGGFSITFHAAYYMGNDKKTVFDRVVKQTERICGILKDENNEIFIRPETTGKPTQWGDLEEIVALSELFDFVLPCVDFSHLHARSGGNFNTYDDFSRAFELIGNKLGTRALENFHAHVAGIEYSAKGEKRHLNLEESDFNYKDLMKAFKKFDVKGVVVCESPNIETDAKILKDFYLSL